MNKRVISVLTAIIVLTSVQSGVFALTKTDETTTVNAETAAENTIADTTVEVTTESETGAETETQAETAAPEETTPAVTESVLDETTQETEPTFQTVEETTESLISKDVELYETKAASEDINKFEEKESDPTLKVFFGGLILGLILGGVCGYFLAAFISKQKIAKQHDDLYESIKHGQTSIVTKKNDEKKKQEREAALKQRKEEAALRKKQKEEAKQSRAEKKAELERKKDEEMLRKLQEKMGITPKAEDEVQTEEKIEIPPLQMVEVEEEEPEIEAVPNPLEAKFEAEPDEQDDEEKPVNPDDMLYQGEDNLGDPYYIDPNDPEMEPFRIIDGRKVFYD